MVLHGGGVIAADRTSGSTQTQTPGWKYVYVGVEVFSCAYNAAVPAVPCTWFLNRIRRLLERAGSEASGSEAGSSSLARLAARQAVFDVMRGLWGA